MSWVGWAVLSAGFAALTAIFAKVGVSSSIAINLATFVRTIVVVVALGGLVIATGELRGLGSVEPRAIVFLILSGLATGASWLCYFRALSLGDAARVAPIDKLSVVLVAIAGVAFLGEKLSATNWVGVGLIASGAVLVGLRA